MAPGGSLITSLMGGLLGLLRGASFRQVGGPIRDGAIRWLLAVAFIPYESVLTIDAIVTTLVRVFITHRDRLKWTTAAHTTRLWGKELKPNVTWQRMISVLAVATGLALVVYLTRPSALVVAMPLLLAWLLSPEIAYWISRPIRRREEQLTEAQRQQLRNLARQTWLFFEHFVGPEDNWLPPDHFQESPRGVVAHRTSPTNVGLFLLSGRRSP
jgi:cyclic beta-1,2-glucan synthetase